MRPIPVHPMSVGPTAVGMFHALCAPYSLGCLSAYAQVHEGGRLKEHFDFHPITPAFHEHARRGVDALTGDGVFLFSSYVWNHAANIAVARHVKERLPRSLVVFGGPEVPRSAAPLREFFAKNPSVDLAVRGEGELAFAEVLAAIADSSGAPGGLLERDYSKVAGVTFRVGRAS